MNVGGELVLPFEWLNACKQEMPATVADMLIEAGDIMCREVSSLIKSLSANDCR